MVEIVQDGNPVLRQKARLVTDTEFGTPELKKILTDMKSALASQDDGVAIAAPQIAIPLRIFVVSGKVIELTTGKASKDLVFINPKISKLSREKKIVEEGCLSVRPYYGKTRRSVKATVRAQDEHGDWFEIGGSGLMAQVFQHETDHLEGILFTDHATDIEAVPLDDKKIEDLSDGDLILESDGK